LLIAKGYCTNKKLIKPILALKVIKEIFPWLYYMKLDEIAKIAEMSSDKIIQVPKVQNPISISNFSNNFSNKII